MNNNAIVPVPSANSNQWSSQLPPMGDMGGMRMMQQQQQQFGYVIQSNGQQLHQHPITHGTMTQYSNSYTNTPSQSNSNMVSGVSGYNISSGSNYQPQQFMSPIGQQNPQQQQNFMSPNMSTTSGVGTAVNVGPNGCSCSLPSYSATSTTAESCPSSSAAVQSVRNAKHCTPSRAK
jgi:hypothetical protein